jgi:hypothetical protein
MKLLYRFLLWQARYDVAIGVATGRNPKVIEANRDAVRRWEHELLLLELNT